MKDLSKYSKFLIAVLGAILTVLAQQYGSSEWVQTILPLATALGVYQVKNQ